MYLAEVSETSFVNIPLPRILLPIRSRTYKAQHCCQNTAGPKVSDPSEIMPPSSKPAAKRGRPAFKPPRPAAKATKNKSTTQRRKSAPSNKSLIESAAEDDENEEDDDDDDSELVSSLSPQASASDEHLPTMERVGTQDAPPTIPPALLTRLLSHFQNDKFRIGKEANGVVGKYMETFVREAIARAAFERSKAGQAGIDGQFLEVSRLYVWLDDPC